MRAKAQPKYAYVSFWGSKDNTTQILAANASIWALKAQSGPNLGPDQSFSAY